MVILDTNAFYYLIGFEENTRINRSQFLSALEEGTDCIGLSSYSMLEALNNKSFVSRFHSIKNALHTYPANWAMLKDDSMNAFLPDDDFYNMFGSSPLLEKKARIGVGKKLSFDFAQQFAYLIELCFLPYLYDFAFLPDDFCPNKVWRDKYEKEGKEILDELNKYYINALYHKFLEFNDAGTLLSQNVSWILRSILNHLILSFLPYRNDNVIDLNNDSISWEKLSKGVEKWYKELDKNLILPAPEQFENCINIAKCADPIALGKDYKTFTHFITKSIPKDQCKFDFWRTWYETIVHQMFSGTFRFSTNNIIDLDILNLFADYDESSLFLTFDKRLIRIMSTSNIEKVKRSAKVCSDILKSGPYNVLNPTLSAQNKGVQTKMRYSIMKIRDQFIDAILAGTKKHEYRLDTPERKVLKPGDQLVLISTQDQNRYVRVSVVKKEEFPNWETALEKYWKDDFSGNYKSIDDVMKECERFYSHDEVKQYGIVVFTIAPVQISYRNKNVLLDTNIVIHRESYSNVTFEVSRLYKWLDELKCRKLIRPETIEEIKRYKDPAVVAAMSTKLASYMILVDDGTSDQNFVDAMSDFKQDQNGLTDNKLLYDVYCGGADLLITDDKLMLSKASRLFIRDQVMSVDEYLHAVEIQFPKLVDYKMLAVKKKPFGKIDLGNPFFDTLKEDYPGFESWFKKKSSEEAYTFEQAGTILGFLYLKREYEDEVYSDIVPVFPKKNRLKVGTFKIDDALSGFRLGERFVKIIFDNAVATKVDEIYVTLFEGKREGIDLLRNLLKKWGFVYWGTKGQESVFVKNMRGYDTSKDVMFNFPNIESHPRLFFLPIKAEYHTGLFPDSILRNEDMSLYSENKGHLYSLEKIYVTNAFPTGWRPGDVLVIYRMGERWPRKYSSVCTGLAVLESISSPSTLEEYLKECKNKSIFSENELVGFYNVSSYRTIVKMIAYKTFDDKITLDELQTKGLIGENSGPRPFEEISDDYYDLFML